MNSIIEVQRQSHEEIERYEQALADILNKPTSGVRDTLRNQHKAVDVVNRIADKRKTLQEQYADSTGLRARELEELASTSSTGTLDLTPFYTRLASISSHYTGSPTTLGSAPKSAGGSSFVPSGSNVTGVLPGLDREPELRGFVRGLEELVRADGLERVQIRVEGEAGALDSVEEELIDPLDSMFSGEESMGKFLDLYVHHAQYVNLKGVKRLAYIQYLSLLQTGKACEAGLDSKESESPGYIAYVQSLHAYLLSHVSRTIPLRLGDFERALKVAEREFEVEWKEGRVEGWQKKAGGTGAGKEGNPGEALDGIWCAACQKTYAKQTVFDAHLSSKKHLKASEKLAAEGEAGVTPSTSTATAASSSTASSRAHTAALYTRLVETLLTIPPIPDLLTDSKQNVERRAALTAREREQEAEDLLDESNPANAAADAGAEEDDDEDRIYNPLKLPLGWDGKPIPYWLFKLHGLGVEYKCEICSDFLYMGRKAFDRHFQESRHAFGMRALGLPNTKHFHEITKIADALALAEKLKHEVRQDRHQIERAEEFEDSEGNVYDKKTFEDLKRQGLI